jgi:hypothetical protein
MRITCYWQDLRNREVSTGTRITCYWQDLRNREVSTGTKITCYWQDLRNREVSTGTKKLYTFVVRIEVTAIFQYMSLCHWNSV